MTRVLDTRTFVVLGEGLAAGVGHFSLTEDVQKWSFPALMAQKLGVDFEQPLLEPPGLGNVGFQELPAIVPDLNQTTVLKGFPRHKADLGNLAVPGFRVADALEKRPRVPMVQSDDPLQTLTNLILGLPGLTRSGAALPTQVEYAKARRPTFVVVCLGYQEVLEPVVPGHRHGRDPADLNRFAEQYGTLLDELGGERTTLLVTTVPNPLDTAYFSDLVTAAKILRTETSFLMAQYGLRDGDLLRLEGLVDLGCELLARQISGDIPDGAVVSAGETEEVTRSVDLLNDHITALAEARGALVYDLHGFLRGVAERGIDAAGQTLTADYLGGFYLLNGIYPGRTGHALIANDLLALLNARFGRGFPKVGVTAVREDDGNTLARLAEGPTYTDEFLKPRTYDGLPPLPPGAPELLNVPPPFEPNKYNIFPIQPVYPFPPFDRDGVWQTNDCQPEPGIPAGGLADPKLVTPLELPETLEQILPLNRDGSYCGDALRPVDDPHERPFLPGIPTLGGAGNVFFGGLVMTDCHLTGYVHVRFSEPDRRHRTRFEITHPGGLMGEDGELAAPKLFRMPTRLNRVLDVPGIVSSGELDLTTGIVYDFHYAATFQSTQIQALFGVNPHLPPGPLPLIFPGPPNSGSSWARFEQRDDGQLDITLACNLFHPMGVGTEEHPTRFPMPFGTPELECASIVARGLTLHPHIHLTTKKHLGPQLGEGERPEIPVNTVVEYTPLVHNTSSGDVFGLHVAELKGQATERRHLLGRVRAQFGPRFGDNIPLAVSFLPPGGLLSDQPAPVGYLPPGALRGMIGFRERLVFPSGVSYDLNRLSVSIDQMNLPVGAVDLKTGQVTGGLLCRCFLTQELFLNLLSVEPCTPRDSFLFRGPARFECGPGGETVFGFDGEVFVPYPKGFKFPSPSADGHPPYVVFRDSRIDPFLRILAMHGGRPAANVFTSGPGEVWISKVSAIGQKFSYRYSIPADLQADDEAIFEYVNEADGGTFRLTRLSWIRAARSRASGVDKNETDTLTFGGFGTWSQDDGLHQVSVHISIAENAPFVGIQVDSGITSNVCTRPENVEDTLPL